MQFFQAGGRCRRHKARLEAAKDVARCADHLRLVIGERSRSELFLGRLEGAQKLQDFILECPQLAAVNEFLIWHCSFLRGLDDDGDRQFRDSRARQRFAQEMTDIRLHPGHDFLPEFFQPAGHYLRLGARRIYHHPRNSHVREYLQVVRLEGPRQAGKFYRIRTASGLLRFGSHGCEQLLEFLRIHHGREESVSVTPGAPGGRGRVSSHMNRYVPPDRLRIGMERTEPEMLALKRCGSILPQYAQRLDRLIGYRAAVMEVYSERLELLFHPSA